jgi:hypothetical protein
VWFRYKTILNYSAFLTFIIIAGCRKEQSVDSQTNNNIVSDRVAYDSGGPHRFTRGIFAYDTTALPRSVPDSIPLKYSLVSPPSLYVDIDGDGNYDVMIKDSVWLYGDPHNKIWIFNLATITSLNAKLKISPGKFRGGGFGDLKKDSVVNNSLEWYKKYICDGWEWNSNQGLWSEYVGLKMVDNSHTYYGWLHKPGTPGGSYDGTFTEFAIDTSNIVGGNVLAGRKKK